MIFCYNKVINTVENVKKKVKDFELYEFGGKRREVAISVWELLD